MGERGQTYVRSPDDEKFGEVKKVKSIKTILETPLLIEI